MWSTVRTPVEVVEEETKRSLENVDLPESDLHFEENAMAQVNQTGGPGAPEHPDGAPLKPQLSVKLGRSISNRTARPHRSNRVSFSSL